MAETTISLFDILSSKKLTGKIKKISRNEVDGELSKHQKKLDKSIAEIGKRISAIEKLDVEDMVEKSISKNDDATRDIIRDEVARIFFTLYVKRNTWS